jgi:hypothetical protein
MRNRLLRPLARLLGLALLLSALPGSAQAQPPAAKPDWAPLSFLQGDWRGESVKGSTGEFSFKPELGDRVLVRRDSAKPASNPKELHEGLMVVYPEGSGFRADFWDNEGHTIHYRVATSEGQAVFTSEEGSGPRFRLTYKKNPDSTLHVTFDVAPPGGEYKTYIEGSARRK